MRKVLGSITLLVLVFNTLLTPLTYAEEYEEIIGTSSENTAEEVVEETGEEESSSEFSVEEENTDEEKDEEETAKEEEEGTEEDEDGEEVENSTGDNVEDGTGEIFEIENGEIEELTGKTVEGETGDIVEELTGTTEELTGVVEESSGTGGETIVEEIKYNEEPIIGEETYDNVTVKVEALSGTFPEGTELVIEPIRYWNLVSLKRELVEERNEIGDDTTLVAFDITFRYEGEEVQPKEGEKVKVIFDYTKNEELVEADKDNSQEVKVYHIEDKDEEGNKVEDEEKKIRDVTNVEESEEDGIAVADGEKFSIYAVVTAATSSDSVQITYKLNGGYWTEDGPTSTGDKVILYTGGYPEEYFKTPSKTGNSCEGKKCMFAGWYTDEDCTTIWDTNPNTATTVYAKWLPFEDLHVFLGTNDGNVIHKILMDRNMGATDVYKNVNDDKTLGYQYQWGNNYGFPPKDNITDAKYNYIPKIEIPVEDSIWGKGVPSKYYSIKFDKKEENWLGNSSTYTANNMWGGAGDNCYQEGTGPYTGRQGPCPDGYHVPSMYEWGQMYSGWAIASSNSVSSVDNRTLVAKDFLLPNNINRRKAGQTTSATDWVGINYMSSSLSSDSKAYGFLVAKGGVQVCGITSENKEATTTSRAVRCVKNPIDESGDILHVDLNGGRLGVLSISDGVVKSFRKPTRNDSSAFGGFYTNENYLGDPIDSENDIIPEGTTGLYAKWDCPDGKVDDGGVCVSGFKISFNATKNGGETSAEPVIVTGGLVSKTINLANYTAQKTGYYFVGWNTDLYATRGLTGEKTYTSNTTLYAIYLKLYTYTFVDTEGNILGTGYYESGVVSDMSKLLTFDYYSDEIGNMSHYEDLITLGLDDPSKGWKWTPSLPEDGIATGNLILHGEKLNKYTVTFYNDDGTDFLSYDVLDGTIIKEPVTHPEMLGYTFLGWYEEEELTTKFDFSSKRITSDTTIYPEFREVLCTFKIGTYNTGASINGFSGTQTEECLTHFVIPSEIEGKPVLRIGEKAFDGTLANAQIISGEIVLPDTLTSIGSSAFNKNNISGTLRIPGGVTTVTNAFKCNLIEEIIFGEGITTINTQAFTTEGCTDRKTIKNVILPSTLKTILEKAFNSQIIEGELELPESLTSIGATAFYGNKIGGELIIPDSVVSIGGSAFRNNQITGLILGNSVQTILGWTFNNNQIEGELIIPNSVTTIGESAFQNNQLTGLILGNSVQTIGKTAFNGNKIEGELIIPDGVVNINDSAFYGNKIGGELIIPDSVVSIGGSAFRNNQITGLILGNSVQTIGGWTFDNNQIEGELIIPNSVTTIGESAFQNNQLTGLILGNSVQTIGKTAFNGNKIEGELIIPDGVVSIGDSAFYNNNISGILRIPGGVTTVNNAFRCNLIEEVIFGEGITTINKDAFSSKDCPGGKKTIKKVTFPSTLESIGDSAFFNQKIEGEFIFPESLTTLGTAVFRGNNISGTLVVPGRLNGGRLNGSFRCNLIENVIIEEGISVIGEGAFYDGNNDGICPKSKHTIKSVQFPSSLTGIESNAFKNHQLTGLIIGENVETIGNNAFDNQYNESGYTLKSVILNDKLQNIGYRTFATNNIKSVYIPDYVETLDSQAFDQLQATRPTYVTGYVTTKKSTLDYTGAFIKPLYQLYTYTFVNENGDILGTGYYPEILTSNTTKLIPLDYYNGIGNINDFTGVDSLILYDHQREHLIWSTPLSENSIVTENLVVTGIVEEIQHYTITYDSTTNGGTKEEQTEGVEYGAHPSLSLYTGYKEGWTFVGWNTNSGATTALSSSSITVTGDIRLYAIYRKEAKILGIVSYPLNGDGITYNEGHDYGFTCTLPEVFNNEEQDTSCTVSMPFVTINDWSRREFIGVNSDSGATENASNIVWETYDYEIPGFKTPVYSGTITLTEETSGKKWYIISKYPSITLTGNFQENGSTILGETSIGCTIGEIYNNSQEVTSCEVDVPEVTPNTNTPTFVGWNTNSGATENDGVSYNNITNKLTLSLANGEEQDWYAITKSSEIQAKLYMHLNGNDTLNGGGALFEERSHNDDSDSSDVKVIFDLCKIPSSYNGNQQFPYCTQEGTMFTFTPNGTKTALGWSATASTGSEILYTPGQTNVTLTGYKTNPEVHLYAQSVLTGSGYSVIFSGNGAKMGTSESDEITLTCKGENSYNGEEETKSKECNVKTPSIIREGYTIQGYTGDNSYETEDPNLITGGSSLKLSSINNGNTYYVSSYKPATIIFDKNGNAAQIKSGSVVETTEEDVVEICNIWNRKENCRITTPEIIPAVGKAVKGYSISGTTYENEIAHKALIDVTESRKYYAWSEYLPVKYTANFEIGTGVEPIVETSGSCMTEVKYNSEEIESSCKVQLPELTAQVGYTNPKWYSGGVEVVIDGERKTIISNNVVFTAKAETHNFEVIITANNNDYGRVTSGLVEAQEGVEISTSGNELTIGDEKVIAIATGDTAQYSYEFSRWNNNCGNVLSGNCSIEAEFKRNINTYTVTYDAASHSGTINNQPTSGQEVAYNSIITLPTTGIRSEKGYQFIGWTTTLNGTEPIQGNTYTVISDVTFYPIFKKEKVQKDIKFHVNNNSGYIYSGVEYTTGRLFSGCTIPTLYNTDPYTGSCEAHITLADIIADSNTPIVLGWSTGENERTISYSVGAEVTITIPEDKEVNLYAQTKSEEKRYTATYVTDDRVEENITEPAYCDIAETYNGEAQLEECPTPIVLPTLTAKVGYHNPIWKLGTVEYAGGTQIALSGNVNLTGTATSDEQTPYVVKHYYQTLTNTSVYELSGEDNLSGATESILTLSQLQKEASSIPGFTYWNSRVNNESATTIDVTTIQDFTDQAEIQSGLVIQLFYTRKNNPVTLHQIGNATVEKTPSKYSYYYGETITFSGHADAGYTFSGWDIREGGAETGRREGTRIEYTMISTGVEVTPVIREHKYTIYYNASGAVGTMEDETVNYSEEVRLPTAEEVATHFTYPGYRFVGWTTGEAVIATLTKATPEDNGEITLYAKWEVNDGVSYYVEYYLEPIEAGHQESDYILDNVYTGTAPQGTAVTGTVKNYPGFTSPAAQEVQGVTEGATIKYYYTRNRYDYTFNAGEGAKYEDGTTSKTLSFRYEQPVVFTETIIKTGYTQNGWNPELASTMPNENKTTTAEWIENQYTINYNANGGVGITPTQIVRYTEAVALTGNAFTKEGYVFTGWSETAEGSVVYKDKALVSKLTGVNNAIVTLYAQWSADSYIVTFDANSGDVAYLTKKVTYDATYGELPTPNRTGYTFIGWYTEKVGGEKITESTKVITAAAHTLYAQWEAKTYTVTFDAEGGEVTISSKEVTYDGEYGELPIPTATGFSFAGWYTGDKIITADTKVTIAADHTLQAHWAENEYTIVFNANGGEGTMPTQRVSYTDEVNLTGNTYTREGYQFIGWSRTENGEKVFNDKQRVTRLASEDNATVILYAVWEKGAYSITYNLNGGTLPAGRDNLEAYDVETANFTLVNPIRTGYTFEGWSGTGIPTLSTEVTIIQGSTGNRVYEANWKAIEYGITYNLNDGILSGEQTNPAIYTIETESFTLENPIRTGYTFEGWSGTALTEPTETVTITEGSIGAREYEAVWSINRYTITWNNRDGTELEKDENVPYGTEPSYNKADPEKTGDAQYRYTFTGWTPLIKVVTEDQVYTAVYEQTVNKYPVTFYDEYGESVLKEAKLYPYGTLSGEIDRPENPSKASDGTYNYEFIGWTPGVATVTTGVDYRATYKATYIEYLVTFLDSTGAIIASGYYHSGDTPTAPAAPQKASTAQYEYTFVGWNPEVSVVTGNIIYTPTYDETIRSYTITWLNDDDTVIDITEVEYGVTPTHTDASKANTAEYTYTFSGWTPEITSVEGEMTYKATYTSTKNKYTITWKNEDGTVIDTTEEEYGAMPTHADASKADTQEYTYTFSGWAPEITSVKGEATYQAVFTATKNSYTVVFKNEDGTSLQSTEVPYGETPVYNGGAPTSGSTAEYEYTFAGWTPEIKTVTGPVEYTATYTANKRSYTITWKDDDGTVIDTTTVEYGKTPVQPTIPSKTFTEQTGYAFNGWTPGIVAVTGETTYTATYAEYLREYTILWRDYDGTVIKTGENISYGTVIVDNKPGDPSRESTAQTGYVFTGWYDEAGIKLIDTKLLTGDMEYTAKYDEKIRTYTIIWNNRDGTELHRDEKQPYGTHIGYIGPVPTSGSTEQYSYTHKGWMPEVHNVLGPQVYTAVYESTIRSYPITFYDEDGTTVIEGPTMYKYGTTSGTYKPTTNPTKEGYSFSKWTPDLDPVVGTASYTASYIINSYNITPIKGVGVAEIQGGGSYPYNSTVTLTGIAKEGYHFEGGVREKAFTYTVPSHDTTLQISAEPNKYYIHFNGNGGVGTMEDQEFTYDEEQSLAPNVYTYNGYYFMSWTDGNGGIYKDNSIVKNLATTGVVTLIAQWGDNPGPTPPGPIPTPTPSGGGSGGSGGGKRIDKDTEEHASAEVDTGAIEKIEDKEEKNKSEIRTGTHNLPSKSGTTIKSTDDVQIPATRTQEEMDAYQYAYKYGITTLAPEEASRPEEYVQRGHMAKMVVNYAINVLHWKLPAKLPKQCKWKDGRNAWESQEIKEYAEKACALGLMGMDMEYFQPYKLVTRAQFGTIFGRLLWGKLPGKPYYAEHLARLKKRGIMTQIESPEERMEVRKWAWLMFMRSEKYFKIYK